MVARLGSGNSTKCNGGPASRIHRPSSDYRESIEIRDTVCSRASNFGDYMTPGSLESSSFNRYPPLGARFASEHLALLRRLPLLAIPSFLEQIAAYDWKFPAEQIRLRSQLDALAGLDAESFRRRTDSFTKLSLPSRLEALDWLNDPSHFIRSLTPFLWSSGQIDTYRRAAEQLLADLPDNRPSQPSQPRLVVFIAAPQMSAGDYPLFRRLKSHGLHLKRVDDASQRWPLEILENRASSALEAYAHWYLDGGIGWKPPAHPVETLTYAMAAPVRRAVLAEMDRAIRAGIGPELLHQQLGRLGPAECGLQAVTSDPVMQRFILDLFTQGSGTQLYSTSFVQWAAREILRRAQPETLVVHAECRVRGEDINDLVGGKVAESDLDPAGSLVDTDMAAYYTWLELQKLPDAKRAIFLAWFPGRREAFAASPFVPRNVTSESPIEISNALKIAMEP
jgi:hypothetical protein